MATTGKVIKCRAAVAWEPNVPLMMEEIEVAPPQEGEIRIKVVATGVCHTDLYHLFEGKDKRGFPTVLGHEGAGVVESVGPGVTDFKPGDKVIPLFLSQCGECKFCKCPKTNLCDCSWSSKYYDIMSDPTTRFTCRGQPVLQFMGTSTFSEYTVINQIAVAKIQDDAPLDRVCLLGCGISTGYGAAVNTAGVTPGSVCAVFGLGAVGLAAVMGCKNAGASRIFAVDINEQKFEKAKVFGATDFLNPKAYNKPISEVLAELTNGGVDFSLECVGNTEVSTFISGLNQSLGSLIHFTHKKGFIQISMVTIVVNCYVDCKKKVTYDWPSEHLVQFTLRLKIFFLHMLHRTL
uniref:Alcohol dehydrogenase 1-like n=1 Tax=Sinocyclocheilus grahami TaxID=75366 RepID=A0A672S6Y3_SINGR